mgnify:CR=1 FL=1
MKKLIPLLFAAFALTACEKDADTDKLDNKFVVYTNYDKNANFKQFNTYYLPDSILIIGDKDKQEYWKDANAQKIIDTVCNCNYIRAKLQFFQEIRRKACTADTLVDQLCVEFIGNHIYITLASPLAPACISNVSPALA